MKSLTPVHQDYLKAVYLLRAAGREATNSAIAEAVGVSPASATNMVKRLAEMQMIDYQPYRGVVLTAAGEQVALEIVRHHRLIELFLHDVLGMSWDQVHADADRLEHVISEEMEEAIARKLGYPQVDPHGDPIPDRDGTRTQVSGMSLNQLQVGQPARLARVRTQDSERLRYLGSLGLYPGAVVTILEKTPFDGPLMLEVDGIQHVLAFDLAQLLLVE